MFSEWESRHLRGVWDDCECKWRSDWNRECAGGGYLRGLSGWCCGVLYDAERSSACADYGLGIGRIAGNAYGGFNYERRDDQLLLARSDGCG